MSVFQFLFKGCKTMFIFLGKNEVHDFQCAKRVVFKKVWREKKKKKCLEKSPYNVDLKVTSQCLIIRNLNTNNFQLTIFIRWKTRILDLEGIWQMAQAAFLPWSALIKK